MDVTEYNEDEGQGYSIEIKQNDLYVDFTSAMPPWDMQDIIDTVLFAEGKLGHCPVCTNGIEVGRDGEFDDRYWFTNGSGSNFWQIKRTPQQVAELADALKAAIDDFNRPSDHPGSSGEGDPPAQDSPDPS